MSVIVQFGNVQATIQGGEWSCEHDSLLGMLNENLDPEGPSGSDPYPDLTAAQQAAQALGGEIVRYDEIPDESPDLIV